MTASEPNPAAWKSALAYIDQWLGYRLRTLRLPGIQSAVYFDERVQFSAAYGLANVETGEKLSTSHRFRIASHSKTFTATAVLQLVEDGTIRLDDPVSRYLPALDGYPAGTRTVRELLEHSGGIIRDGVDPDYWELAKPFPDEAELVGIMIDNGEVFEANRRFKYSNIGYSVLGMVIAAVTGTTYNDYVREHIVDALGLTNTVPEWSPSDSGLYAAGHTGRHLSDTRRAVALVDTGAMSPATGFCSTASDLVEYFSAHVPGDERLLSDASKRLQQHESWSSDPDDPDASSYGLGMSIKRIDGHRMVGHSGGYPGHKTQSLFDPDTGLIVSVLVNAADGPAADLAFGVIRILDLAIAESTTPKVDLARYTGRFATDWEVLDIAAIGGRLFAIDPGAANPKDELMRLEHVDDASFRIEAGSGFLSVGEKIEFRFGDDGVAESIHGLVSMTRWPAEPED